MADRTEGMDKTAQHVEDKAKQAEKQPGSGITDATKKDWDDEVARKEKIKQEGVDKGKAG